MHLAVMHISLAVSCSLPFLCSYNHMWQSHVEIEGYSVTYFECIAMLEAP